MHRRGKALAETIGSRHGLGLGGDHNAQHPLWAGVGRPLSDQTFLAAFTREMRYDELVGMLSLRFGCETRLASNASRTF
jgi:hypothetical protein